MLAQCCLLFNLSYYSAGGKEKLIIYENFFAFISIAKSNMGFVHLGTTIYQKIMVF